MPLYFFLRGNTLTLYTWIDMSAGRYLWNANETSQNNKKQYRIYDQVSLFSDHIKRTRFVLNNWRQVSSLGTAQRAPWRLAWQVRAPRAPSPSRFPLARGLVKIQVVITASVMLRYVDDMTSRWLVWVQRSPSWNTRKSWVFRSTDSSNIFSLDLCICLFLDENVL